MVTPVRPPLIAMACRSVGSTSTLIYSWLTPHRHLHQRSHFLGKALFGLHPHPTGSKPDYHLSPTMLHIILFEHCFLWLHRSSFYCMTLEPCNKGIPVSVMT